MLLQWLAKGELGQLIESEQWEVQARVQDLTQADRLPAVQYATRVRTIKNDVTKNESSKEVLKLQRQLEYWKEQAGLSPAQRAAVELTVRLSNTCP